MKIRKLKHDQKKKQNKNQNHKKSLPCHQKGSLSPWEIYAPLLQETWCPAVHTIFGPDIWTILMCTMFKGVCWGALSVTISDIRRKKGDKAGETWEGDNEDSSSAL